MNISHLGAQLYTARKLCQTARQTAATLEKIRAIGYAAVEVAGICEIPAGELVQMAKDTGLTICAVHDAPLRILNEPQKVLERVQAIGCDYICYPFPEGIDLSDHVQLGKLTRQLEKAGQIFWEGGKTFCYHHHSFEFARCGKSTVLDYIIENVDARYLSIELDTYWVQHGGGDPVNWCKRLKKRVPLLHLKEYGSKNGHPVMMEIGNGNLCWPDIVEAAEASQCKWFIVEQDECSGDPLDSLKTSFDYIRGNLARP